MFISSTSQFRLYVGIISSIQPPPSKKRFPQEQTTQPDEADDDEDDDEGMVLKKPAVVVLDPEAASEKRREEEEAANAERRKDLSEEAKAKIVKRHELKEARMDFFLNDPEMALMIFFSAHYRDRGLMWCVKLRSTPNFSNAETFVYLGRKSVVVTGRFSSSFSSSLCSAVVSFLSPKSS